MSMDALVESVLGQARSIAEDVVHRSGVRLRTATVTQEDPLQVQYDGEDSSSVVTPRSLVRPTRGNRVVVAKSKGQGTILGVLGGPNASRWERITWASGMDYPGHGFYMGIQRDGPRRYLRGRVSRVNGEKFTAGTWTIGQISPDDMPTQPTGGIGQVEGFASPGFARLEVQDDGQLVVGLSKSTAWVGVDGMSWDTM